VNGNDPAYSQKVKQAENEKRQDTNNLNGKVFAKLKKRFVHAHTIVEFIAGILLGSIGPYQFIRGMPNLKIDTRELEIQPAIDQNQAIKVKDEFSSIADNTDYRDLRDSGFNESLEEFSAIDFKSRDFFEQIKDFRDNLDSIIVKEQKDLDYFSEDFEKTLKKDPSLKDSLEENKEIRTGYIDSLKRLLKLVNVQGNKIVATVDLINKSTSPNSIYDLADLIIYEQEPEFGVDVEMRLQSVEEHTVSGSSIKSYIFESKPLKDLSKEDAAYIRDSFDSGSRQYLLEINVLHVNKINFLHDNNISDKGAIADLRQENW
jgi:hypothetical protein